MDRGWNPLWVDWKLCLWDPQGRFYAFALSRKVKQLDEIHPESAFVVLGCLVFNDNPCGSSNWQAFVWKSASPFYLCCSLHRLSLSSKLKG